MKRLVFALMEFVRPALIQFGFLEQQNLMLDTKKKLILNIYRINIAV